MIQRSQAEVEQQFVQRRSAVSTGKMTEDQAFNDASEWSIELADRDLIFHPGEQRWYWFNRVQELWEEAGIGLGEGILVVIDGVAGAKIVPDSTRPIADWCLYMRDRELFGPILLDELHSMVRDKPALEDIEVWSPSATSLLPAKLLWPEITGAARPQAATATTVTHTCTACGTKLPPGAKFCTSCGTFAEASPPATTRFCIACGAKLKTDAKFCTSCGAPVNK